MVKRISGRMIFQIINVSLLSLVALIVLFPLLYILASSFSSGEAVIMGKVWIFPYEFTLSAYEKVVQKSIIWSGYLNTIYLTVFGTLFSMFISICGAYPLSKKRLKTAPFFTLMILFTMWFNPGQIPVYLNLKSLGMLNSINAIIVAFGISAFNVVILKSFFQSIPESLEEAAIIDGANDFVVLGRIYLPLSIPTLVTITLFYALSRWNGYFWSMVLLKDDAKMPLQVILKKLIVETAATNQDTSIFDLGADYSQETIIYATIVISILPMLVVYPFMQKYFVKGVMIGSVKG